MFLYFVSFMIVVFGVFIFNLKPIPVAQPRIRLQELFKLRSKFRRKRSTPAEHHKDKITAEGSGLLTKESNSNPDSRRRGSSDEGVNPPSSSIVVSSSSQSTYGSYSRDGSDILRRVGSSDSVTASPQSMNESHDQPWIVYTFFCF